MNFIWKDHKVSNNLLVFNYYKKNTGRSIEKDLLQIQKVNKILDDPKATPEEIEKASACDIDAMTVFQNIYYAMRCAGENRELDMPEVIAEISISDLTDGSVNELINSLVNVKKKDIAKKGLIKFLK